MLNSNNFKTFNGLYSAATFDEDGNKLTDSTLIEEGFHVANAKPISGFEDYLKEPETGRCINFSGVKGAWYIFPDEATYTELAISLGYLEEEDDND